MMVGCSVSSEIRDTGWIQPLKRAEALGEKPLRKKM
jgi:hypothetical protein